MAGKNVPITSVQVGPINQETGKKDSIPVGEIQIPDLWHVAQDLKKTGRKVVTLNADSTFSEQLIGDLVLDLWHLAHDLRRALQKQERPSQV